MKHLSSQDPNKGPVYVERQTQEFLLHAQSLRRLGDWAASEMKGIATEHVAHFAEALVESGVVEREVESRAVNDGSESTQNACAKADLQGFDTYLDEARRKIKR